LTGARPERFDLFFYGSHLARQTKQLIKVNQRHLARKFVDQMGGSNGLEHGSADSHSRPWICKYEAVIQLISISIPVVLVRFPISLNWVSCSLICWLGKSWILNAGMSSQLLGWHRYGDGWLCWLLIDCSHLGIVPLTPRVITLRILVIVHIMVVRIFALVFELIKERVFKSGCWQSSCHRTKVMKIAYDSNILSWMHRHFLSLIINTQWLITKCTFLLQDYSKLCLYSVNIPYFALSTSGKCFSKDFIILAVLIWAIIYY